jgi:serine/threonine protein kinase
MPTMTVNSENFGNRFNMLQELGKGANGEVHLAFDKFLQRPAAIKIIRVRNADERFISSVGRHV